MIDSNQGLKHSVYHFIFYFVKGRENIDIPVIHCFLSAETSNTESTSNNIINADELNVGHFFRPIFGENPYHDIINNFAL